FRALLLPTSLQPTRTLQAQQDRVHGTREETEFLPNVRARQAVLGAVDKDLQNAKGLVRQSWVRSLCHAGSLYSANLHSYIDFRAQAVKTVALACLRRPPPEVIPMAGLALGEVVNGARNALHHDHASRHCGTMEHSAVDGRRYFLRRFSVHPVIRE